LTAFRRYAVQIPAGLPALLCDMMVGFNQSANGRLRSVFKHTATAYL